MKAPLSTPYTLVDGRDPILTTKLDAVGDDIETANYISARMFATLDSTRGVGLAANQCGVNARIFIIAQGEFRQTFIDPVIVEKGKKEIPMDEGCLSYPGLQFKVRRPKAVVVEFTDLNGNRRTERYSGLTARIFQHELDHLNGIRFFDRLSRVQRERFRKKFSKM